MRVRLASICNHRGLHARAAAQLVKEASRFDATISVEHRGVSVPATSIMGLMMLAAGLGAPLTLRASGPQAEEALETLGSLIDKGFGENETKG